MDVGDEGRSWNDVVNKKKNRSKGIKGNTVDRNSKGAVTKFFISNLPRGCNPWDVADFVKVFGEVSGVYIARKLDKEGRWFGFVSFKNVDDVKEMERALNGTKMGDSKLVANLARFAKENVGHAGRKVEDTDGIKKNPSLPPQGYKIQNQTFFNKGKGKLYSELFNSEQGNAENKIPSADESGITIELADETLAFKELIGRALVGRCKDLKVLRNLNSILAENRIAGVSLSYLGGLAMLLNFDVEERCVSFLLEHLIWREWFTSLDPWEGQSLPFEGLAWVKVQGVPIHLADNDVLNNIVEYFGKIVHGSQMEADDENLSVSWIGLLVRAGGRIQEHVALKCKNKLFRVWIEEEITDWTPDSVGPATLSGDNVSSPASSCSGDRRRENNIVTDSNVPFGIPTVPQQEFQQVVDTRERSAAEIENINIGNDKSRCCNNSVGKDLVGSVSHVVEENFNNSGGAQPHNQASSVFFFNSVDKDSRPKKGLLSTSP
ncbi:putative RNA recognition motif domain, nucleotide-binding alpha-beta plait domain superfamily [Helianthus annuus]|nr:putative RNA recognition motif domain, nucleotide-binding alpha-beta plait domain superfamily [Helianthus annuus]KAJ0462422.1 putative RNA recognition motif domain, nucleotide-binding alpha-beta plait domain superfamily [Helianthus annuus]KAJ0642828.1 putative RNA recognition motif domain, nucleotide-binding alpha-beta plait domain superfamily [Helianthus annuus]KAJ0823425.1 putative RNA recognition motif domain, nucleotide-binding alpha-beta plait domain superfamily [Helianthus annuus]